MSDDTYWQSPIEDKRVFDCARFKVNTEHVVFALRHSRQVSEAYWLDDLNIVSIGCHASVTVHFKNGDVADVTLEPTGRVFARPRSGRGASAAYHYLCRACVDTIWWDDPERPSGTSKGRR